MSHDRRPPSAPGLRLRRDAPLAPLTTLELGGTTRYLVEARNDAEVIEALRWAGREDLAVAVIGHGSNLVVADSGFDGLVVRVAMKGFTIEEEAEASLLTVAAGEPWDEVVERSIAQGLTGLECLSGIPGSAGATPIQNVGAYGREVADVIAGVRVLIRSTMTERWIGPRECRFGYRSSWFRHDGGRHVVLEVKFRLERGGVPEIRYPKLASMLADRAGSVPDGKTVREAVLELRRSKSMVLDDVDPNRRSVGSFFVNPVVEADRAETLRAAWASSHADRDPMPHFDLPSGEVKIPAAWLIERAGYGKGYRRGSVGISSRHSLALVHNGAGSSEELLDLAREIRSAVVDRFGIAETRAGVSGVRGR